MEQELKCQWTSGLHLQLAANIDGPCEPRPSAREEEEEEEKGKPTGTRSSYLLLQNIVQ